MARIRREIEAPPRPVVRHLVDRLADELHSNREYGQPFVDERVFPTGRLRITVVWDEWDRLPLEDRTTVILHAYERVEGRDFRERIALASGLTVPEAHAAGMLPFQIVTGLRKGDPVTAAQCRDAMLAEGASTLLDPRRPQLRFATEEDAEAARQRLIQRLAGSEQVWITLQDVGMVPAEESAPA